MPGEVSHRVEDFAYPSPEVFESPFAFYDVGRRDAPVHRLEHGTRPTLTGRLQASGVVGHRATRVPGVLRGTPATRPERTSTLRDRRRPVVEGEQRCRGPLRASVAAGMR